MHRIFVVWNNKLSSEIANAETYTAQNFSINYYNNRLSDWINRTKQLHAMVLVQATTEHNLFVDTVKPVLTTTRVQRPPTFIQHSLLSAGTSI